MPAERAPTTRPNSPALALLAVAAAAGVALVYVLWVRTRTGQRLDQAALNGRGISHAARDAAGHLLSTISDGSLAVAVCVLAALAFVRHRRTLALVAAISVLGAVVTTEVLKLVVLQRPALIPSARDFQNTYPSGHTTVAYAVGIAATLVAPPRARRAIAVLAFLYGTAIGLSTVVLAWHRPSDVVGGLLVATGWAAATVAAVGWLDADVFGPERTGMRSALSRHQGIASLAAVAILGWLAVVAVAFRDRAPSIDLSRTELAFALACVAIAAFAAVVFGVLLAALRPALARSGPPARPRP